VEGGDVCHLGPGTRGAAWTGEAGGGRGVSSTCGVGFRGCGGCVRRLCGGCGTGKCPTSSGVGWGGEGG